MFIVGRGKAAHWLCGDGARLPPLRRSPARRRGGLRRDTLWATAAFLGIGLLLPRASTWRVAFLALSLSVLVEVGQLYHAPWIDSIRRMTVGGLVLGYDFVWSDVACYAVGVGLGVLAEWIWRVRSRPGTDDCLV